MSEARELEIIKNLRAQGVNDNQIIGTLKYYREKLRVQAANEKLKQEHQQKVNEFNQEMNLQTLKNKKEYQIDNYSGFNPHKSNDEGDEASIDGQSDQVSDDDLSALNPFSMKSIALAQGYDKDGDGEINEQEMKDFKYRSGDTGEDTPGTGDFIQMDGEGGKEWVFKKQFVKDIKIDIDRGNIRTVYDLVEDPDGKGGYKYVERLVIKDWESLPKGSYDKKDYFLERDRDQLLDVVTKMGFEMDTDGNIVRDVTDLKRQSILDEYMPNARNPLRDVDFEFGINESGQHVWYQVNVDATTGAKERVELHPDSEQSKNLYIQHPKVKELLGSQNVQQIQYSGIDGFVKDNNIKVGKDEKVVRKFSGSNFYVKQKKVGDETIFELVDTDGKVTPVFEKLKEDGKNVSTIKSAMKNLDEVISNDELKEKYGVSVDVINTEAQQQQIKDLAIQGEINNAKYSSGGALFNLDMLELQFAEDKIEKQKNHDERQISFDDYYNNVVIPRRKKQHPMVHFVEERIAGEIYFDHNDEEYGIQGSNYQTFIGEGGKKGLLDEYDKYINKYNVDTDGTLIAPFHQNPELFIFDEEREKYVVNTDKLGDIAITPSQKNGYTKDEFEKFIVKPYREKLMSEDRNVINREWDTRSDVSITDMVDVFADGDVTLTTLPDNVKAGEYVINDGQKTVNVTEADIENYKKFVDYKEQDRLRIEAEIAEEEKNKRDLKEAEIGYSKAVEEGDEAGRLKYLNQIKQTGLESTYIPSKAEMLSQYNISDGEVTGETTWQNYYSKQEMKEYYDKMLADVNVGDFTNWSEDEIHHLISQDDYNNAYTVDKHGLFSSQEIMDIDGNYHYDFNENGVIDESEKMDTDRVDMGVMNFRQWYRDSGWSNKMDVYYEGKEISTDSYGRFDIDRGDAKTRTSVARNRDTWKQQMFSQYLQYKRGILEENQDRMERLGGEDLIAQINIKHNRDDELTEKVEEVKTKYHAITTALEDGTLEKTDENIDKQNSLANQVMFWANERSENREELNNIVGDKYNMSIVNGYMKVGEQQAQFQQTYLNMIAKRTKPLTDFEIEQIQDAPGIGMILGGDTSKKNIRKTFGAGSNSYMHSWGGKIEDARTEAIEDEKWAEEHPVLNTIGNTLESVLNFGTNVITGSMAVVNKLGGEVLQLLPGDVYSDEMMARHTSFWTNMQDDRLAFNNFANDQFMNEDGSVNWWALPNTLVDTVGNIFFMARGGWALKLGAHALISKGGKAIRYFDKGKKFDNAIKFASKPTHWIGGRIGLAYGTMPVIYPQNLRSAMEQIDEDFTVSDAMLYSSAASYLEASIELLNPDFKLLRSFRNFKAKDARNWKLWKDGTNATTMLRLFKNSLSQVPVEMLEENLQLLTGGMLNTYYNNMYNTEFHIPDSKDYKETNILTPMAILVAGGISTGGFRHGRNGSLFQAAASDIPAFEKEMRKALDERKLTPEEYDKAMKDVIGYSIIKEKLVNEKWFNDMPEASRREIINATARKNIINEKLKDKKISEEDKAKLEEELKEVNKNINDIGKKVDSFSWDSYIKVYEAEIKDIAGVGGRLSQIGNRLKDPNISEEDRNILLEEKKELIRKKVELEKWIKGAKSYAPEYVFNNNTYKTREEFLKAINEARENGYFDGINPVKIKVNYDSDAVKMAYEAMGEHAPKYHPKVKSVMSAEEAAAIEAWLSKPGNADFTIESLKEQLAELEKEVEDKKDVYWRGSKDIKSKKKAKDETLEKIHEIKQALKYLNLKEKGYEFNPETGYIVGEIEVDLEKWREISVEQFTKAAQDLAEKVGIDSDVLSREEIKKKYPDVDPNANGFFTADVNEKGETVGYKWVVNKDVAAEKGAFTTSTHEALHGILWSTINGEMRQLLDSKGKPILDPKGNPVWTQMTKKGKELIKGFLKLLPKSQVNILNAKLDAGNYRYYTDPRGNLLRDENGKPIEKPFELYGEEYFTMYHDAVVTDKSIPLEENRGVIRKIIDYFKSFFKKETKSGIAEDAINTPEKMLEFLRGYNKQAIEGKFDESVVELARKSYVEFAEAKEADRRADEAERRAEEEPTYSRSMKEIDSIFPEREKLVKEVNDIYDDPTKSIEEKGGLIGMKYRGMAESRFDANLASANVDQRQVLLDNKEDIIAEMLYDPGTGKKKTRNVLGLVQDFEKERHKYGNIAAYINTFFKVRSLEVFDRYVPEVYTKSLDDAFKEVEQIEDEVETSTDEVGVLMGDILLGDRIKDVDTNPYVSDKVNSINETIENLITENPSLYQVDNYKQLKDLVPQLTSELFSDEELGASIADKINNNANLSEPEIKAVQRFIFKHHEILWSMLPQGHVVTEKGKPGTATGVQNVLLAELYNKSSKRVGNNYPQFKKPIHTVSTEQFLDIFGITPRGEMNKFAKSDNTSQRIKALISQAGQVMTNQAVRQYLEKEGTQTANVVSAIRNGMTDVMYSRTGLSGDKKSILFGRWSELASQFASHVDYDDYSNVENAVRNVFGKEFTKGEIRMLSAFLHDLAGRYKQAVPYFEGKIPEQSLGEFLMNYTMIEELPSGIMGLLGNLIPKVDGEIPTQHSLYLDIDNIRRQRANVIKMGQYMLDTGMKPEKVVETIFKYLKGMYQGAGKIADGRFTINEDFEVVINEDWEPTKINKKGEEIPQDNRKKVFENIDDLFNTVKQIKGLEGLTKVKGKYILNGKTIDTTTKAENSNAFLNAYKKNKKAEANAREKQGLEARGAMEILMDFHIQSDSDHKYTDMAMATISAFSGMESLMRKAAYVKYMAPGVERVPVDKRGEDLEYEHMIPANRMAFQMVSDYVNKGGIDENFWNGYHVAIISSNMDRAIKEVGLGSMMQVDWVHGMESFGRYYGLLTIGDKRITTIRDIKTGEEHGKEYVDARKAWDAKYKDHQDYMNISKATMYSRNINPNKGISVFDFDETAGISDNYVIATKEGETIRIASDEWPSVGEEMKNAGWEMDFSDFNKVTRGRPGPLMQKLKNQVKKYGNQNVFILTARAKESEPAIKAYLESEGVDLPIENITGLGNSTGEAKAMWMLGKVAEGYNDFYFVDDATQNVKAVKNVLDQVDVKSKVQQTRYKYSRSINPTFDAMLDINRILEQTKGVESGKRFSEAQAKIRGSKKGRWKFWVPPSAEDFKGLIYRFVGKGKQGDTHMAFFKKALFDPYERGYAEINRSRQMLNNDYRELLKAMPEVRKLLKKKAPGTNFTYAQAIRVYLWNKNDMEIPGISKRDLNALVELVQNDTQLRAFADTLSLISRQEEGYSPPGEYWTVENIQSDINRIIGEIGRENNLKEWKQNIEEIFGTWENSRLVGANINKIEAIYGSRFREALEDIIWRMEFGTSREAGRSRIVNAFNNWANQSVGAIMFFNMRSALLQTISSINYINWSDNNPLKAGFAFANQTQFWKDFAFIFNSDMLKQRRTGHQRGINEAELAEAVAGSSNKAKAALNWLLTKGFLPTQIADSFAIAAGGATFYRNRVNTYLKQGMDQKAAEKKAWEDFQGVTEESQQSARPDLISQQQASPLGRYILAFKNTPMQYMRLTKKAWLDLINGRGDPKTNISKIVYYMAVQNFIFSALQSALSLVIGGGGDDEEKEKKWWGVLNSMLDSVFGGLGIGGQAVATIKNTVREYLKQEEKGPWTADHTYTILRLVSFSPTIGSKVRKVYSSIQTDKFNRDIMGDMSLFDIDNPIYDIIGNLVSATTNLPLDRIVKKKDNLDAAITEDISTIQRIALIMGWNTWDLGIKDQDIVKLKEEVKIKKKSKKKKKEKEKEKKKIKVENIVKEEKYTKDQIKEREQGKEDITCVAVSKGGVRCKTKVEGNNKYCTVHEKVEQRSDGEKTQCTAIKSDKKRCKMKTSNKSGKCYYHD